MTNDLEKQEQLKKRLLEKSKAAFISGLEMFNKPINAYRLESFAIFICNAWELMLKVEIIKRHGIESIYFSDNPDRTISLLNSVRKIFTNDKDPLRKNLEKIIDLRDASIHLVTEMTDEYGAIYTPLFQACIMNYKNKMRDFHNIDISEGIPDMFFILPIDTNEISEEEIYAKYPDNIAARLINHRDLLAKLEKTENNPKFSIGVTCKAYITKDKESADTIIAIDNNSSSKTKILRELKDPSNTHNHSFCNIVSAVNRRIKDEKIPFEHTGTNGEVRAIFNRNDLSLFIKKYDLRKDEKYTYNHKVNGKNFSYSYSSALIDFIVESIKKDPKGIIGNLKSPD